jgi:hypothetical protein
LSGNIPTVPKVPVPVTLTLITNEGLVGSLLPIVTVPVFAPVAAGVPVTVKVAVAPAAIGLAGVSVPTAKSVEPVIDVIVRDAVPVFLIVNEYAVAAIPFAEEPTEMAGLLFVVTAVVPFNTCNAGAGAAVPVTLTFSLNEGVTGSFVTIVIVPVLAPSVAGVPVTVNVVVALAATEPGVVIALTTNPVEPVTEVTDNAAVPVFLIENEVYAVAAVPVTEEPTEMAGALLVVTAVVPFNTLKAGTGAAVPVTLTFNLKVGVVGSFVTIVIVPVLVPSAAGVPVTVNVTEALAATEPGVVIALTTNPAEPVTEVTVNEAVPVFLIENEVYALAAVPITEDPTEMAGVLFVATATVPFNTLKAGAGAVADRYILYGFFNGSLFNIVRVPVLMPLVVGWNVSVKIVEEFAPTGLIVCVVSIKNSGLETLIEFRFRLAKPKS